MTCAILIRGRRGGSERFRTVVGRGTVANSSRSSARRGAAHGPARSRARRIEAENAPGIAKVRAGSRVTLRPVAHRHAARSNSRARDSFADEQERCMAVPWLVVGLSLGSALAFAASTNLKHSSAAELAGRPPVPGRRGGPVRGRHAEPPAVAGRHRHRRDRAQPAGAGAASRRAGGGATAADQRAAVRAAAAAPAGPTGDRARGPLGAGADRLPGGLPVPGRHQPGRPGRAGAGPAAGGGGRRGGHPGHACSACCWRTAAGRPRMPPR